MIFSSALGFSAAPSMGERETATGRIYVTDVSHQRLAAIERR
jgi:hypothetical protein